MNRKIKSILLILVFVVLLVVIRLNVTAIKENPNREGTGIVLEPNSEIVTKVLGKLDILNDSVFKDDVYQYLYFDVEAGKSKKLSSDELLYLSFEKLYKSGDFTREQSGEDIELLSIGADKVSDVLKNSFGRDDLKLYEIQYKVSSTCGIVGYLYTGDSYELKFNHCDKAKKIHKVKYQEALRVGDVIKLRVKSFYAETDKKNYKEEDKVFDLKNYGKDTFLEKLSYKTLQDESDNIFETYTIDEFVFDFAFKDDDYHLLEIFRV